MQESGRCLAVGPAISFLRKHQGCLVGSMIDSFTEITGAEWYSFCSKDQCRWLDVKGLTINDKEYGQGAVTNVQMRETGSPIINVFFESHHGRVQFNAESFQETEVSLWVSDSQVQIIRQEAKEASLQQNKNNEKIYFKRLKNNENHM
mgnify:CR=1 FL=1